MYLTYKEIFEQYEALRRTYDYLMTRRCELEEFYARVQPGSLTFLGAGSGYTLCISGEISTKIHLGLPANALAAGDLMINFKHYQAMLKNSLIIAPSRSGGTSEVIRALSRAKAEKIPSLGISAQADSPINEQAELVLEIPWAFDESVCQTRTVTNFYAINLILIGIWRGNEKLLQEINQAITHGPEFMARYKGLAIEVANHPWEKVVILADSELEGVAQEGALAFMEIPQIPSNYFHVLDVRHGPIILIDEKTLVLVVTSPSESMLQKSLVQDLKAKGAKVVTLTSQGQEEFGADWQVAFEPYEHFGVLGIPFIFIPQAIAYYKAIALGLNPDLPQGLEARIDLDQ